MTYQTTITKKGQIVIPKDVREALGIKANQKITFIIKSGEQKAIIKPARDILDIAGKHKPRKITSAFKLREEFEKNYERK